MTDEAIIEQPKIWQRQPEESAKAFHAFMLYRDMLPKKRSIQKVLETFDRKPSYYRHLARWSSKYHWVERVIAYDVHLSEVKREAQEHAIVEMAERHAKEGMALQTLGLRRFMTPEGKIREGVALNMDDRDALRAIDVGSKLERTARGEPTEIVKEDISIKGKSISDMTDAELDHIIQTGELPGG